MYSGNAGDQYSHSLPPCSVRMSIAFVMLNAPLQSVSRSRPRSLKGTVYT